MGKLLTELGFECLFILKGIYVLQILSGLRSWQHKKAFENKSDYKKSPQKGFN